MESPLKKHHRIRLARRKAEEGATTKRKRTRKGAQVSPLGLRLEKRWKTSAELGKRLALRTREARKDKHRYLAAIYGVYVQGRRANKLETLWRRAQPAAGSMPATPKEIIAGLIRGTYADKELERDSVSQWSQVYRSTEMRHGCALKRPSTWPRSDRLGPGRASRSRGAR